MRLYLLLTIMLIPIFSACQLENCKACRQVSTVNGTKVSETELREYCEDALTIIENKGAERIGDTIKEYHCE